MRCKLQDCLLSYIDNRGVTPTKLKGEFSSNNTGIRVLSANNVKSSGLIRLNEVRHVDQELYAKWMPSDIQRGDILLTSEAPAGEVLLWNSNEKVVVGQRLYALRVNPSVADAAYLAYYLQSAVGQREIMKNLTGSTVMGVSQKTFENIVVDLPPLAEQEKIGQTLLSIDEQIQRNNAMVHKLQVLGQAIYGRYASHTTSMMNISEIAQIIWGTCPPGEHLLSAPSVQTMPYASGAGDMTNGLLVTPLAFTDKPVRIAQPNDICVSVAGTVGRIAMTNQTICIGRAMLALRSPAYGYVYFGLQSYIPTLQQQATGAIQKIINNEHLKIVNLPMPSAEIIDFCNNFLDEINRIEENTQYLQRLRDVLLPILMNGQVTV